MPPHKAEPRRRASTRNRGGTQAWERVCPSKIPRWAFLGGWGRDTGKEGRIGNRRERCWRGRDAIHGSLARQASHPAIVALGGFPLRHYPPLAPSRRVTTSLVSPLPRAHTPHTHTHTHHTHPLSPPNLPPFTRFHSYEHVEKGRSLCVKLVPSAPMNVLLCMRAFFSLGNVGMGVRDRGGDGREERGRKRGNGSRRAEEQNAVAVPVR